MRDRAEALDRADALAPFRRRFSVADSTVTYLDGNSLGSLPRATETHVAGVVRQEWGERLIRSWNEGWNELPERVGDLLARTVLGCKQGQVVLSDSTTVNLYKLLSAALEQAPERRVIVTDDLNFPTDRYVVEGLARSTGRTVHTVASDPIHGISLDALEAALDDNTAVVTLSHVDFRSGAIADLAGITRLAREAGALVVWDLSHSVGAVPVELDASGVDLAVGCTYKYLNGGPGAPAFLYVRKGLQDQLRQPIWGWFSQAEQFAMGQTYQPTAGIRRFLTGTPSVLAASAVEASLAIIEEAGIDRIRAKGQALTGFLIELFEDRLADLGFSLASPADERLRGSHVTLSHPDAYRICRALIEQEDVIPDFRTPDGLRLGLSPLTTRFVDVWDGIDAIHRVTAERSFAHLNNTRLAVT